MFASLSTVPAVVAIFSRCRTSSRFFCHNLLLVSSIICTLRSMAFLTSCESKQSSHSKRRTLTSSVRETCFHRVSESFRAMLNISSCGETTDVLTTNFDLYVKYCANISCQLPISNVLSHNSAKRWYDVVMATRRMRSNSAPNFKSVGFESS